MRVKRLFLRPGLVVLPEFPVHPLQRTLPLVSLPDFVRQSDRGDAYCQPGQKMPGQVTPGDSWCHATNVAAGGLSARQHFGSSRGMVAQRKGSCIEEENSGNCQAGEPHFFRFGALKEGCNRAPNEGGLRLYTQKRRPPLRPKKWPGDHIMGSWSVIYCSPEQSRHTTFM